MSNPYRYFKNLPEIFRLPILKYMSDITRDYDAVT